MGILARFERIGDIVAHGGYTMSARKIPDNNTLIAYVGCGIYSLNRHGCYVSDSRRTIRTSSRIGIGLESKSIGRGLITDKK